MAETLPELLKKVTEETKRTVLASSLLFPKTESLAGNTISVTHEQFRLDIQEARRWLDQHSELVAINARDDVCLVLDVLKELQDDLALGRFDSIVIYRSGLDVLRLVNKSAMSGRSVYVMIDDYRRLLHQVVIRRPADWSDIIQIGILALGLLTLGYVVAHHSR